MCEIVITSPMYSGYRNEPLNVLGIYLSDENDKVYYVKGTVSPKEGRFACFQDSACEKRVTPAPDEEVTGLYWFDGNKDGVQLRNLLEKESEEEPEGVEEEQE